MYPKLRKPLSLFLMTTHLSLRNYSVQTEIAIITKWCITSFLTPPSLALRNIWGKNEQEFKIMLKNRQF
jgi:hypothetical protein